MLESLVAWVLNNYLGKYVDNLNTLQLSVALLSGAVELENLPLKKGALRQLGLPIEIKAGFIGKIRLEIPLRQIRSAPWVIIIEQLYVVVCPISLDNWDPAVEEEAKQELKLCALDKIEARWRLEMESKQEGNPYHSKPLSWFDYGTSFVADIIENLQLKINDVHIRYEDSLNIPNQSIACGITMESLSVQSCDSTWSPGFASRANSIESFKLLDMQQLSIYWTSIDETQLFSKLSFEEFKVVMSPSNSSIYNNSYVLPKVSAQAHVKRNRSEKPLRSTDTPRIVCDLILKEVPLTLIDSQYEQMVNCLKGLHTLSEFHNYRYYRPDCSVKSNPKAWWLYAISCFSSKQPGFCKPKATWESYLLKARQNVEYVNLYTQVLMTPAVQLSVEIKQQKDSIERSRDYEELKVLREIAMKLVPKPNCKKLDNTSSTGRGVLYNWFPQWMGWYSSPSAESENANEATIEDSNSNTIQLEGEILKALEESIENNTLLKRDVIFGRFNFSLNSGTISLCTARNNTNDCMPMLELEFKNLSLNIISRPRSSSYLIELSLGALYLHDKLTPDTLFAILVGPPSNDRLTQLNKVRGSNSALKNFEDNSDAFFSLAYERKADNEICNYRLQVKSKSFDVVYQPAAVQWLIEFFFLPHQRIITQKRIEAVKLRTKKELIRNWEQILGGHKGSHKNWELKLDISAPRIIFVEQFTDLNATMAVVDFGRFQLDNIQNKFQPPVTLLSKESEEDDMFMTPCSTPPGSGTSINEPLTMISSDGAFSEENFHDRLYDQYCVEMTDLQILIGRVKDNWKYAHNKGTSALHILDKFNISLKVEHRVVQICDPKYPSLTLNANLPELVAHINEQKIINARGLIEVIRLTGLPSPFNSPDVDSFDSSSVFMTEDEDSISIDMSMEMSKLLLFQFTVNKLSLEVQSRGRCIAELQVTGVNSAFSKTPAEVIISLSVQSLLLVDALQTFGRDFELLVASHKRVGMDSMSGSLRDSEPTSPISPASPEPNANYVNATSPIALTHALNILSSSPIPPKLAIDSETLISIEVILKGEPEPKHIANIQFNNLDIIANQETIVELIGFTQRVFPEIKRQKHGIHSVPVSAEPLELNESLKPDDIPAAKICRMELTFDFHRLNVLIFRGIVKDDCIVGRKIATATMSKAKIAATVDSSVIVEGSLGGLQVLDLTPEGHFHQRIISVGHDPLIEVPQYLYTMMHNVNDNERKAFSFKIDRKLGSNSGEVADVTIRMASVWYTHSPQFLLELQSCATEFKQYLANLARSIRSAATDMALGLVHARAEAIVQSLYINSRLSSSLYGSALSLSDMVSPKRRSRYNSYADHIDAPSGYSSTRDTISQTPYTPGDDDNFFIDMKLDIVLDSPIVVLPRAANSNQVFIAHLGKTSVSNHNDYRKGNGFDNLGSRFEHYSIEVKDMNLFSLDTSTRRVPGFLMNKPETLYCCKSLAKPILHDTIVQLKVDREIFCNLQSRHPSLSDLLDNDYAENEEDLEMPLSENINITGSVVTALKVSLTSLQYEQLLDTFRWLTAKPAMFNTYVNARISARGPSNLDDISEEDTGVTTLQMDPHVRAKLFPTISVPKSRNSSQKNISMKATFELPIFTVELKADAAERGVVNLSFQDFLFNYERCHQYETSIQVSLRSVVMEDLLQPSGSRHRDMVVSSSVENPSGGSLSMSRSCPDTQNVFPNVNQFMMNSLPNYLEPATVFGVQTTNQPHAYPSTPPPSPSLKQQNEKNLVLISTLLIDPAAPNFKTLHNSIHRTTSVDFNCLDLAISVESWVMVVDFFNTYSADASSSSVTPTSVSNNENNMDIHVGENTETNITVKSLNITLFKSECEIAKANVSLVNVGIKTIGKHKEVEGCLGCMSLLDLTLQGQLYKERFLTSGKQALRFNYVRYAPNENPDYDAHLELEMSSILYVHTKRFVVELQAFFQHFTQLQSLMQSLKAAASTQKLKNEENRLSIRLQANAPVILVPVSSKSSEVLIADLGKLSVVNCFKQSGSEGTISLVNPAQSENICLLDCMTIYLQNVDLYCGTRVVNYDFKKREDTLDGFNFGSHKINKVGPSLLTEKCHLEIKVEHNLDKNLYHSVPDMSMHGELSTLDVALDLHQYQIIKDLLMYNLGENTEQILPSVSTIISSMNTNGIRDVWTLSSLKFDLLNVILRLQTEHETSPLARINFIKSRLTVESFSNLSQDVDLVSQEILLVDTRFEDVPDNRKSNVFTNILKPINYDPRNEIVQAEIHSRRRQDRTKFTILLNNMRLMAIFDWWDAALKFILDNSQDTSHLQEEQSTSNEKEIKNDTVSFELKLNITDSEIIVVEDPSQWDTNTVIFKSTTVLSYKPHVLEKPLSCNLNNCEMYSCILGSEEETALSIIDPVTLNMEVNKSHVLEVQLQSLMVRLSYHDLRMFLKILNSLPQQMFGSNNDVITQTDAMKNNLVKLSALNFTQEDCMKALECNENRLDDAALWLTQNAISNSGYGRNENVQKPFRLSAVEVKADCICLCVIDDCGDSDVPLLEISLVQVNLRQRVGEIVCLEAGGSPVEGALECRLSADYYNRLLSGWEPIVEQWNCSVVWDHILTNNSLKNRLQLNIESHDVLNINITTSLVELYQQTRDNWMQDYYNLNTALSNVNANLVGYRRRSPFVPFALKNESGVSLYFTTVINDMNLNFHLEELMEVTDSWILVAPGETVPFSFKSNVKLDKRRHGDSHRLRMHQLGVKLDGWNSVQPVTVDKVGTFFRNASAEIQHRDQYVTVARVVFDVSLEGSARKLVTVRSSLLLENKLEQDMEVKYDNIYNLGTAPWMSTKSVILFKNTILPVPLSYVYSQITVRPIHATKTYTFCNPSVYCARTVDSSDCSYDIRSCHSPRDSVMYKFCSKIKRENYHIERSLGIVNSTERIGQPAHTITLLPTILLINLLPIDLGYIIEEDDGHIAPGCQLPITCVDPEQVIELKLRLENFPINNPLTITPGCVTSFSCRIRMQDSAGRRLFLHAVVVPYSDARIKITISVPYWIINKTGVPLVFRQRGVTSETAGQFNENEMARMVAPLLFSFSDPDASPSVVARIGSQIEPQGLSQWSDGFDLQRGIKVRKLIISMKDGRRDVVYLIGIEVRTGRGQYRHTHIVTISPRYQLFNKSSYYLLFSQNCFTTTNLDSSVAESNYLEVVPQCHIPFNWQRLDKEQLLCVCIKDIKNCCWSGGFKIDKNNSMHLNIRDIDFHMYFLRLEVVLQRATFFVVFTDADKMPPPIRIDNFSEVSISFAQSYCKDSAISIARAHTSVPYAWDQPTKPCAISITAPGGVSSTYDMNKLGSTSGLTYENFIYIAFMGTFKNGKEYVDPLDVESQQLVLDVIQGGKVVLSRKQPGQRSQLWRMTTTGQLQHEGSSPPSHPQHPRPENILVLDIEGPAPQPTSYTRLMVRRLDPRRRSTQTWRFTEEGRLCCAHYNMCVQAQDGFFGVRQGNAVVLGLPQPICHQVTQTGIPLEQAITRQRLRPGSGFLTIDLHTDGPTRVLEIRDMKEQQLASTSKDADSSISENSIFDDEQVENLKEMQFTVRLAALSISLISRRPCEELIFAQFTSIVSEAILTSTAKTFCISVKDIQCDNQLFNTSVPVVLYVTPPGNRSNDVLHHKLPALEVTIEIQPTPNENTVIFKHLIVRMKKLTINLEEKLLLKLCVFFKAGTQGDNLINNVDESEFEAQRLLNEVSASHAKRYYFGVIQLVPDVIKLSMKTANKLSPQLQVTKRKLGFTFIKFEDASVELESFIKRHMFETSQILTHSIVKHFKDELLWQAGSILGSIDVLGNPLGLMNDVTEGMTGLLLEGSVKSLVKNVTHGLSNSAAKVTESLSDGLGRVAMDDEHEEMRQKIRQIDGGKGGDHIVAGLKGLGFGIFGGATGIFKQVYEGASNEGIQGIVSGFGKGMLGAVTKPIVGVLDLATETARAVRDSSKSSTHLAPKRLRPPRCAMGPGGLLPSYSKKQSQGQQLLYLVNDRCYSERLVAYERLISGTENLRIIISSERVRIVAGSDHSLGVVLETHLSDLMHCQPVTLTEGSEIRHYIEITMRVAGTSATLVYQDPLKKPRIRCDSMELAHSVSQQLNYAKKLYNDSIHTVGIDISQAED